MKVIRRSEQPHQLTNSRPAFPRNIYFFYEKNTGVAHFHVEAGPDGGFPVDQAAGLLAMHCMVRGQSQNDYVVLVQTEDEALEGLSQLKPSRREEEILSCLMKSLANNEIAANLNLSERTVKFHVSSLLAKFRVRGRMELVREASRHAVGTMPMPLPVATREASPYTPAARNYPVPRRAVAVVSLAKRQLMA